MAHRMLKPGVYPDGTMDGRRFAEHIGAAHGTVKRWLGEPGFPCRRKGHRVYIQPATAMRWIRKRYPNTIAINRTSVIYFIRRDSDRAIKIGWATDLVRRYHEITRDERCVCLILACYAGGKKEEIALHKRFQDDRLDGEWYEASTALLGFIGRIGSKAA